MFRHKAKDVVIPQYEHLKLVGLLAQHWGNKEFSQPDLPLNEFITACYTHDLGFGAIESDTHEIGNMNEDERKEVIERCVNIPFQSPITQVIVNKHFLRLLDGSSYDFPILKEELNKRTNKLIEETNIPPKNFNHADNIIDLLDAISFDYSWGISSDYSVDIPRNNSSETVKVSYKINGEHIFLSHWPFDVKEIQGAIIAYDSTEYPQTLVPVLMPFNVKLNI